MLNIKSLDELEIILPKLETQEKVAQIQALSFNEIKLLRRLIEEKQNIQFKYLKQ